MESILWTSFPKIGLALKISEKFLIEFFQDLPIGVKLTRLMQPQTLLRRGFLKYLTRPKKTCSQMQYHDGCTALGPRSQLSLSTLYDLIRINY